MPSVSTNVEQLAYVFYLDIDDDASWDYIANIENLENGLYNRVFFDRAAGGSFEGDSYPGPATLADRDISLGLSLDDLGCPEVIAVRAATESIRGDTNVGDAVPNSASKWLRISTGC